MRFRGAVGAVRERPFGAPPFDARCYGRAVDVAITVAVVAVLVISIGMIVGVQARVKGRVCPSCNRRVSGLDSECRHCGYDFRMY